ncbi:MAG: MBL fold metallo-hydrolase [Actinomycetota bacterium]
MRLTVLGCCGTYPSAGGACSGYLLSHDGFSLWIDAGSGTLAHLQRHTQIAGIDAVAISHMHADHFTDLYPFLYALEFGPGRDDAVPVYGPKDGPEIFGRLLGDDSRGVFPKIFDWNGLAPGEEADIGPFRLRTFPAAHSIENLTMRIEAGGAVLCYSGDTGPNASLVPAARGADLFLCEASWQDGEDSIAEPIHMTARQAGRAAAEAGAGRLVLTHIWPHYDLERSVEQAAEEFDGIVEPAHTAGSWTIGA